MLRYYSYYSVGGYKDFMLGTSEGQEKERYYFPLLPVFEDKAKSDPSAKAQVDKMKSLPEIPVLSSDNSYDLPKSADRLISHAAYKIIFLHLEGSRYALSIRNVRPVETDETGRSIPFLFLITGENAEDTRRLEILATYMALNTRSVENMLSEVLDMDFDMNGLKFKQQMFNEWIEKIINENPERELITIDSNIKVEAAPGKVSLLVLPRGITQEKAVEEQKLEHTEIVSVPEPDVVSFEDKNKLTDIITRLRERESMERKQNEALRKGLAISALGGLIVGGLAVYLFNK